MTTYIKALEIGRYILALAISFIFLNIQALSEEQTLEKVRVTINPELPTETGMYCTTKIVVRRSDGRVGSGTGFFFRIMISKDTAMDVIITNKHVVRGTVEGSFVLHQADPNTGEPNGSLATITLDKFESRWIMHPTESTDLCATPILPITDAVASKGGHAFYVVLNETNIKTDEELRGLGAMEDVVMIGYPKGLGDELNNYPILRRGITATHPAVDFNGEGYTLVDIACFPGSSGSPVIIQESLQFQEKATIPRPNGPILLGVLAKGPVYNKQGALTSEDVPVYDDGNALPMIPIHLGYLVRAREISALLDRLKEIEAAGDMKLYVPIESKSSL